MNGDKLEIGRVLRAATVGFSIGCRVNQLSAPGFGSMVMAQPVEPRETIYGLIYNINIDDDQLIRRLVMVESPRQEVIEDQRRNRLLPIEMSVLSIGYKMHDNLTYGFPPRPPLNLDPVYLCQDVQGITRFTNNLGYLRLVLRAAASNVPVDQLLVAHVNNVYQIRGQDTEWALSAIHELIELLRGDYEILIPTLEALSTAIPELEIKA